MSSVPAAALGPQGRLAAGAWRWGWWVALAASIIAFSAYLQAALGPRADLPTQVDEIFFLTCAVQGKAAGSLAPTGCHDNKGPAIFWLYETLVDLASPYRLAPLKCVGAAIAVLNAALLGLLARRLFGPGAAILAFTMMLGSAAAESMFVTLKTEPLGLVFVLTSLVVLAGARGVVSARRLLGIGVLFGVALLAKQSYLFALLGLLASALFWPAPCWPSAWLARVRSVFVLGLGVLIPFAMTLAWYQTQHRLSAVMASLFLYPSLYGDPAAPAASGAAQAFWKLVKLAEFSQPLALLMVLALLGTVWAGWPTRPGENRDAASARAALRPTIAVSLGLWLMLVLSPTLFRYHLMPVLALAVVPASAGLLGLRRWLAVVPHAGLGLSLAVPVVALVWVAAVLRGPGIRSETDREFYDFQRFDTGGARYAYVQGMWPEFFVANGLIPASEVMYPNALPGTPSFWGFKLPPKGSPKALALARVNADAAAQLMADFARTPPAFIHVVDFVARAPGSQAVTDVPFLNEYLQSHCRPLKRIEKTVLHVGTLYACEDKR
jgi:hypothetical protein